MPDDELDRHAAEPIWLQIESRLASEIGAGVYPEADRFPSESELSQRFGVNRHTVRRAIAGLAQRGLVRVERGRGAFVAARALDYLLSPRTRFTENLMRVGRTPQREVLREEPRLAEPEIAEALELTPPAEVWELEALLLADGAPIGLAVTRFAQARLPGIGALLAEAGGSATAALARLGHAGYRRKTTRVTARAAAPTEATRLLLAHAAPVLITDAVDVAEDGAPLLHARTVFAADRVQFLVEPGS